MVQELLRQDAGKVAAGSAPAAKSSLRDRILLGLIIGALLLPLLFPSPREEGLLKLKLGLPRVFSGDEPHYLLALNSLLLDGDLNLANNYAAVHEGATQAGKYFGGALDHHTVWYENGERREWWRLYEFDATKWDKDSQGNPVPHLRDGQSPPVRGHPEYPIHPPGLAFLLAPLLFPFRGTTLLEPLAIVCSTLAIVWAMFLFRKLILHFDPSVRRANLIAAAAFLGTPAWHYGRTLFTEPYLLLFAVGSYSLALRGRSHFAAGLFIGLGILMKPPFLLVAIPIGLMLIREKKFRALALFTTPLTVSTAVLLWLNFEMFGSPWRSSQEFQMGSFFTGATGLLFSWNHGCFPIAPALFIALVAWPSFHRAHTREALMLMGGAGLQFLLFSAWPIWEGGMCYGPRFLVPVLPLLCVSLVSLPTMKLWRDEWVRHAVVAICLLSIGNNFLAANPYWKYWGSNPLVEVMRKHPISD